MTAKLMYTHLERIRIWLQRDAPDIASSLQPPLTSIEIKRIMGPKEKLYRIPTEVVELYRWQNGQAGEVPFFDSLRFQPFEEAVAYGNLVEEYFSGAFPLMLFQEFGYDAGYQVRCGTGKVKIAPVYRWDMATSGLRCSRLPNL